MNLPPLNVLFAGTPDFASEHLKAILASSHNVVAVVTQPDKPGKRGRKPLPSPVKTLAVENGITVCQPERLTLNDVVRFSADVMVVVAYGQILRKDVLDLPRLGCVNVHASLLPRWRGAAPIQRAILAGDPYTGVCTMQMEEGLDTGDVLLRRELEIHETDTAGTLTTRLAEIGSEALIETLSMLASATVKPEPQSEVGVTYAHKIEKEEARVEWRQSSIDVERQIRAFNPDPIAFSVIEDLRVRFWQARVAHGSGAPGEVLGLGKQGLEIACGDGSVLVERLQLPVGKGTVISAHDLANSPRPELAIGNRFNP